MSLLRLLTAGKSLIGSKNDESRYHLSRRGALPRFGAKKNPFRATTRPEAAQSAATASVGEEPLSTEGVGLLRCSASLPANELSPPASVVSAAEPETDAPVTPCVGGGGAFARYAGKLKSLLRWRFQKAPAPVVPRFSKPLIQGELSLERVRVVRNDLSDSDVEIVPVKAAAAPAPEAAVEGSWEKVTGRLFGAGKV